VVGGRWVVGDGGGDLQFTSCVCPRSSLHSLSFSFPLLSPHLQVPRCMLVVQLYASREVLHPRPRVFEPHVCDRGRFGARLNAAAMAFSQKFERHGVTQAMSSWRGLAHAVSKGFRPSWWVRTLCVRHPRPSTAHHHPTFHRFSARPIPQKFEAHRVSGAMGSWRGLAHAVSKGFRPSWWVRTLCVRHSRPSSRLTTTPRLVAPRRDLYPKSSKPTRRAGPLALGEASFDP